MEDSRLASSSARASPASRDIKASQRPSHEAHTSEDDKGPSQSEPVTRHSPLPSPESENLGKRKRGTENCSNEPIDDRPTKQQNTESGSAGLPPSDPVSYWVLHDNHEWGDYLKDHAMAEVSFSASKRTRSQSWGDGRSYSDAMRKDDMPAAWTSKHQEKMDNAGIFMRHQDGAEISDESQLLCDTLLESEFPLPADWCFQRQNFHKVLNLVENRNEARIMRDLHPLLMPSPETFHARGHSAAQHIAEGVNADWSSCTVLCGPKPRADATHGVAMSAFDPTDEKQLASNNTCAFESAIFPFYMCEVKTGDKSMDEAERQAMHDASVAANAVVELYQSLGSAHDLHRHILCFSMVHNHHVVRIHAHFAMVDGDKFTYHRHLLYRTDLFDEPSKVFKPFQITLAIWEHFFPVHLQRIRDALARQKARIMPPPGGPFAHGLTPLPASQFQDPATVELGPIESPIHPVDPPTYPVPATAQDLSRILAQALQQQVAMVRRELREEFERRDASGGSTR